MKCRDKLATTAEQSKKKKYIYPLEQVVEAYRVVRHRGFHIF
jgi:hypothetical protein